MLQLDHSATFATGQVLSCNKNTQLTFSLMKGDPLPNCAIEINNLL